MLSIILSNEYHNTYKIAIKLFTELGIFLLNDVFLRNY